MKCSVVYLNNQEITFDILPITENDRILDAPARLIDGSRTLVPLRAVSEAFDCIVNWSGELQRVDILE
ncbi:MAG: copper amine oxidase N-terminal domain-containing protein [Clostridiales bacterium]|nr:copper amine oxidase N-terminal domain-containing protein [Clostridiales bacterium]